MQVRFSLLVATALFCAIVSCISARQIAQEPAGGKRGFRLGAGDRFSHGFGKRFAGAVDLEDVYSTDTTEESGINIDTLTELLSRNPELLRAVLDRYFDNNGDGVISRKELGGRIE